MIDYKKLLIKYRNHVTSCEGINFVSDGYWQDSDILTEEEAKQIEEAENNPEVDPTKVIYKAPIMIYEHKSEPEKS